MPFCLAILIFAFSLATSLYRLLCGRICIFLCRECILLLLLWQPRPNPLQGTRSFPSPAHHLYALSICVPNYHPQSSCIRARECHICSRTRSLVALCSSR